MTDILAFLVRHGEVVLFLYVFADQLGVPLPAVPILLAAGGLAGAGRLSFPVAVGLAVIANRPFSEGGLFQRVRGRALPEWATALDCESWAQFFLKWILAHSAVTCVIPATSRPQHLVDNMKAGTGSLPDAATRERMAALVATR